MPESSPWLDARAYLLMRILMERYALRMTLSRARVEVYRRVVRIADNREISRSEARMYITQDFLEQTASALAAHAAKGSRKRSRHLTVLQ